jgi:hypothetical protein
MRYVNLTPPEVAQIVYKALISGLIDDARIETNTRTVYVKKSSNLIHSARFGIFSNNDLLKSIWIDCGCGSKRYLMQEISGPDNPEWCIKYI